jgi:hypothetical protein
MPLLDVARAGGSGLLGGAVGWPMDTGVSLVNLLRALYGYGGHRAGLLSAANMPDPIDPKSVPGTSASISGLLGVGDSGAEQVAEMVGGLLSPGPKAKAPTKMGWTAYHGSPHKFDKFQLDKIGTGEGAQAYGHGLYFAENPETAKSYMTAGSSVVPQDVKYKGKNADQWYTHFSKRMERRSKGGHIFLGARSV